MPMLDTADYWGEEDFADVAIAVGDATFKCHRFILAKNSQYLAGTFTHPTITTAKLENDAPAEAVEAVLKYIYGMPWYDPRRVAASKDGLWLELCHCLEVVKVAKVLQVQRCITAVVDFLDAASLAEIFVDLGPGLRSNRVYDTIELLTAHRELHDSVAAMEQRFCRRHLDTLYGERHILNRIANDPVLARQHLQRLANCVHRLNDEQPVAPKARATVELASEDLSEPEILLSEAPLPSLPVIKKVSRKRIRRSKTDPVLPDKRARKNYELADI
ncbi:hypothetical protein LTR86_009260 [Recurvomyces mirabilis]|nr:hypothetical protein LTR86_009260 [Recurvomyces mirabilis]